MKNNLTIEDVVMYLPHKVMAKFTKSVIISPVSINMSDFLRSDRIFFSVNDIITGIAQLIMHPLSDLTSPITVKGYNNDKPFVPIVELAKVAYPSMSQMAEIDSYRVKLGHGYSFFFSKESLSFDCQSGWNGERWDYNCFVPNQYDMFQLLAKWHFWLGSQDMFGKEIIDINTLK
jgi:hypothetical protein